MIVGVRKAEGGMRASLKTCFDAKEDTYDKYRPLFWYKNEDESEYDKLFDIKHSDCYEVWGFTRTGCVGCPYNRKFDEELEVIRERATNVQGLSVRFWEILRLYTQVQAIPASG